MNGLQIKIQNSKNIFYRNMLQDMKNNNKLVIVITHDDRYFRCADRIIFVADGKMISIKEVISLLLIL